MPNYVRTFSSSHPGLCLDHVFFAETHITLILLAVVILDCINMMLQPVTVRCRCDSVVQRRTSTWVNTNLKWVNLVSLIEVVSCLVSPDHLFTYMFHLRL